MKGLAGEEIENIEVGKALRLVERRKLGDMRDIGGAGTACRAPTKKTADLGE